MGAPEGHTPGPWRWEWRANTRTLSLLGGRPQYDLVVMDFSRVGMGRAGPLFRDPTSGPMQLLHRVVDRPDWIEPFPGREHHADWCASLVHPDARLIAAAPDLLDALRVVLAENDQLSERAFGAVVAAIDKAEGRS